MWDLKYRGLVSPWTGDHSRDISIAVPESPYETIGANIRRIRKERGFTQEGFAQHIQLDRAYYGRIERGQQNMSTKTILMLGAHLRVDPAEFFVGITVEACLRLLAND